MKRIVVVTGMMVAAVLMIAVAGRSDDAAKKAKILGIWSVRISTSDLEGAREFYGRATDIDVACRGCMASPLPVVAVFPSGQQLEVEGGGPGAHASRVVEVAFAVDDLKLIKQLLQTKQISFEEQQLRSGALSVLLKDPEGNGIRFVPQLITVRPKVAGEEEKASGKRDSSTPRRIIHAGWVVKDREAMDKFYRDVLGFHLYWQGGMKDDRADWVSMQVPDGTDWIEYMLNIPPDASKHLLGVMNHIALGVPSVHAAAEQLKKNGVKLTEEPKIGRDGKWQLNLYDPDDTRLELMEFTPVEKPCCSEFTGTHPKP